MREFDVVVVRGGTAGLSAALALGRSRRRTLVCGSGEPRNAPSHEAHSFFTRDGASPTELLRMGASNWRHMKRGIQGGTGCSRFHEGRRFEVVLQDGTRVGARKLLLATGMKDELPHIEGLQAMWGVGPLHCPYCHGWEVRDQPIALYGSGEIGFALCVLLTGRSRDLVLCTDGPSNLTDEQQRLLDKNNIPIYEGRISRFEERNGQLQRVVFEGGEELSRQPCSFVHPRNSGATWQTFLAEKSKTNW
jgi:thioredoxin reductase